MRQSAHWRPSKYVFHRGQLRASRDARQVAVGSRSTADLVAAAYQRALTQHARGRLLDLGCGQVPLYAAYRDHVDAVTCADWANSRHPCPYLDVECDLTERLPLPDAAFDTLILSDVLEHIPEPLALWNEMARVLAPGGKLLLSVPFLYWLHERPHDYYRYTEFALRRFVELSGFVLCSLDALGGAPEVLTDIGAKLVGQLPLVGSWLSAGGQAVSAALLRTGPGLAASRATAPYFPLAYFLVAEKR